MRVFFYVQHLLGIGHLKRAATLAHAMRAAGLEVTLASGGMPVASIPVDVQLAPMSASDMTFSSLIDQTGRAVDDAWKRRRAARLIDVWRATRADALIVELFPFGRRQMRFELLPLLEDAQRVSKRPLVACSVRDIIQSKPGRDGETVALVERYFDRILIHGDPRVVPFERTFALAGRLESRLHYTGYVVDDAPGVNAARGEVLVSAGGGAVGRRLLETAIDAREHTLLRNATWRLLAGVSCSDADFRALSRKGGSGVIVERSRDDFQALLGAAALSISQAGYNTVAETLKARVRALFVPFAGAGESEQTLRAGLLAERGAATVLAENELTVENLAAAVDRAAKAPQPSADIVDLNGAQRTAELMNEWLSS
jgi:predicted glycosyltransferase